MAFVLKEVETEELGVLCLVEVCRLSQINDHQWDRTVYLEIFKADSKENDRRVYKLRLKENLGTTCLKFPRVLDLLGAAQEYFGMVAPQLYTGFRNNLIDPHFSLERAVTGVSFRVIDIGVKKPKAFVSAKSKWDQEYPKISENVDDFFPDDEDVLFLQMQSQIEQKQEEMFPEGDDEEALLLMVPSQNVQTREEMFPGGDNADALLLQMSSQQNVQAKEEMFPDGDDQELLSVVNHAGQ